MFGKWRELQIGSGGEVLQSTDDVSDLPHYKTIVKAVLRKQILSLIEELCAESGEDIMVLSANVSEGTLATAGSQKVEGFMDSNMATSFYKYCQSCSMGSKNGTQSVRMKRPAPLSVKKSQSKSRKLGSNVSSKSAIVQSFGTESISDNSSTADSMSSLPVNNDSTNFTMASTGDINYGGHMQNRSALANEGKFTYENENSHEKYKTPQNMSGIKQEATIVLPDESSSDSLQQRQLMDSENSCESVERSAATTSSSDNQATNSMNMITQVKVEPDQDSVEYGGSNVESSMDACDMDESFLGHHMGPDSMLPSGDQPSTFMPQSVGSMVPAASIKYTLGRSPQMKRVTLTLEEKMEILKEYELNPHISQAKLARKYEISRTAVQEMITKSGQIRQAYLESPNTARKRLNKKPYKFDQVNEKMYEWYKGVRNAGIEVSGTLIKEKALQMANEFNLPGFKGSNGWLQSWKIRYNIGNSSASMSAMDDGNSIPIAKPQKVVIKHLSELDDSVAKTPELSTDPGLSLNPALALGYGNIGLTPPAEGQSMANPMVPYNMDALVEDSMKTLMNEMQAEDQTKANSNDKTESEFTNLKS